MSDTPEVLTPDKEKALTTIAQSSGTRFLPQNLEQAKDLAKVLAASNLIPQAFQGSAANTLVAIMKGAELGLTPVQALGNIFVVNGRPSLWGDAVIGLCESSGQLEYWEDKYDEETKTASFTVKRKGKPKPITRTFSMEDAKQAGLDQKPGPWKQYPKRMLFNRARAFALRDTFADRLMGLGIVEELQDIVIDVTPVKPEATPQEAKVARAVFSEPVKEAATVALNIEPEKQAVAAAPGELPLAQESAPSTKPKPKPAPKSNIFK